MKLGTDKTALMVIDMQNAFCHPGGSLVTQRGFDTTPLQGAVEPCVTLVNAARAKSVPIIFTQYVYLADYADAGWRMREVTPEVIGSGSLAAGTWDVEFVEGLEPQVGDIVVQKNRPSAFYATPLESYLRSMAIESLVICGVTTNICVETTARDAGQRDYRTFVVADATAEMEPDRHEGALKALALMFARVLSIEEVLGAWNTPGTGH